MATQHTGCMLQESPERSQARDGRLYKAGPAIQDMAPEHGQGSTGTVEEKHQLAAATICPEAYLMPIGGVVV